MGETPSEGSAQFPECAESIITVPEGATELQAPRRIKLLQYQALVFSVVCDRVNRQHHI